MRVIASPYDAMRVFLFFLLTVVIAGAAIAAEGFHPRSLAVGGLVVLTGGLILIQTRRLFSTMDKKHSDVSAAAKQAEKHYIAVLRRIVNLVEARDKFTQGHSDRVGEMAERLARHMKLPASVTSLMALAGQLHDIGMLVVPTTINRERTRIGVDEFRTITRHADIGYEVLKPLRSLEPVLPAVRHHHERMNGTGYPDALTGTAIPLEARLLAVADAFDAMTHDRPHRPAMTTFEAVRELSRCTPAGYDPDVVDALADLVGMPRPSKELGDCSQAKPQAVASPEGEATDAKAAG